MAYKTRSCKLCKSDFEPVSSNQLICKPCRLGAPCNRCKFAPRVFPGSYCSPCTAENSKDRKKLRISLNVCVDCEEAAPEAGFQRCKPCLVDKSLFSAEKYQRVKRKATQYLGGKCADCGLKTDRIEVYDFHHLVPEDKEHGVGDLMRASWELLVSELDKCTLLCANCHRIRERNIDYTRLTKRCEEVGTLVPSFLTD